jgi:hypothetical protein
VAIIFSLYAECRDAGAAAAFSAHFDGVRWTLSDGTETTLEAGPYAIQNPGGRCWVTPSNISISGPIDDADAIQMTELGQRLCAHLRTAPPFELALVGIEVDQERDEAELADMIRDGWSGLIVTEERWQRAGAPIELVVFREGMRWHPYTGEWISVTRRHVPDVSVVRCLGCDESIRPHELVRLEDHGHSQCCVWHPYHVWCWREAPPRAHAIVECADCGAPLDLEQLRATVGWGAATPHHLHVRSIEVVAPFRITERADTYATKPPGVSRRAVWTPGATQLSPHDYHELVHDACPTDDEWRLRLRAAPRDDELRRVYADELEQRGELGLAMLVRALVELPATDEAARNHGQRIRELATGVPRGWLRDVGRRG